MSRGAKIGCGVVLGLFVVSALVCAGLYLFAKDYFVDMADEFAERRPQLEASAKQTAAGGPDACVAEGLARTSRCSEFAIKCRVEGSMWTKLCLEAATVPPEFCKDVPPQTSIMEVSMWGIEQCQKHGRADDSQCPQFFSKTVAAHCDQVK